MPLYCLPLLLAEVLMLPAAKWHHRSNCLLASPERTQLQLPRPLGPPCWNSSQPPGCVTYSRCGSQADLVVLARAPAMAHLDMKLKPPLHSTLQLLHSKGATGAKSSSTTMAVSGVKSRPTSASGSHTACCSVRVLDADHCIGVHHHSSCLPQHAIEALQRANENTLTSPVCDSLSRPRWSMRSAMFSTVGLDTQLPMLTENGLLSD